MEHIIQTAKTEEERQAIYRFRYKVYIEEMQKLHVSADHENKFVSDEADAHTILYYTLINQEIAATVRAQRGTEGRFTKEGKAFFGIDAFEKYFDYRQLSIIDRLIVDKPYRRSLLTHQMMLNTYVEALQVGTRLGFISCDDALLPMYLRYGFRIYAEPAILPTGELRHRLLLFLCDEEHLQQVRSPFVKHLPPYLDDKGYDAALAKEKLGLTLLELSGPSPYYLKDGTN
jgi:predicted GNAT family N-acyltransferase